MPSSLIVGGLLAADLGVDGGGDREQPHLAGLDLVGELAQPGHARVDRAREDRRVGLAAAGVRDVLGLLAGRRRARARARPPAAGRSSPPSRPPSGSSPGRALKSATRSLNDRYFDLAGTTIPSLSVISVAIGVVRESGTSEPLVSIAPSITSPVIISWYGSPEPLETSWESPSVPPAPSTLKTSIPSSSFAEREAPWNARAVVSQPPPGGRRRHDRELARRVRLRRVVAAGRPAGQRRSPPARRPRRRRRSPPASRVSLPS